MIKKNKTKFELTNASNGYIIGLINPNYNGPNSNAEYYKETFVGTDLEELFRTLVSALVIDRMNQSEVDR